MTTFKYPLEDRFVQLQVGDIKLLNLQIVCWLNTHGYFCKNDGIFLYFETEDILMHFVCVWAGKDKIEEAWTVDDIKKLLEGNIL